MPLLPFDLYNDETRLIVHDKCLYKLKLTYKSEISLKKILASQRDETNTELIKVIRAILFLIKAEKDIPHKISTPCFMVCVAVKFWKITLKLGFSKNGTRLKCGHVIDLTLYLKQSRIKKKEFSKANTWVNAEPFLESNHQNKIKRQQLGPLGLRQFVINSDESDTVSDSNSDILIREPTLHSKSIANEYNNTILTDIDGPTENLFRSGISSDSLHNQTKPPDHSVANGLNTIPTDIAGPTENLFGSVVGPVLLHNQEKPPDQSVINKHHTIPTDIAGPTENLFGSVVGPVLLHNQEKPPDQSVINKHHTIPTDIDEPTENLFGSSDLLNSQSKPSDPMISDQIIQTVSISVTETLIQQPPLLHPPEKATASVQDVTTFISSCTQTDIDELDFYARKPYPNPENLTETFYQVHADHNYFKNKADGNISKHVVSNSKEQSTDLGENKACKCDKSVTNLNSENIDYENNSSSVDDDNDEDVNHSFSPEEVSSPAEFLMAVDKNVEILNAVPEDVHLDSLSTNPDTNCKDNDIWAIGSKQLGVISGVEMPMESLSESCQDDGSDSSNPCSEIISNQSSEKYTEAHQSSEQEVQDRNSSSTERKDSSQKKVKISQYEKPKTRSEKNLRNRLRIRSLQSYDSADSIPLKKIKKVKKPKKSPNGQMSTFYSSRTLARRKSNKSTPQNRMSASSVKRTSMKRVRKKRTPKNQVSVSRKKTPPTTKKRKRGRPRSKGVTHKEKTNPKSQILQDQREIILSLREKKTSPTGNRCKRGRSQSKDVTHEEETHPKSKIPKDQKKITSGLNDRFLVQKKTPLTRNQRQKECPQCKDVIHKETTSPKSGIPVNQREVTFGLHDRFQVQTQELQEDLKLQNLAHPSSTNANKKGRSFMERFHLGYFLRS